MQLFYSPNIAETDTHFQFNKEEGRHIVRVLRKNKGDRLWLTNGQGYLFEAEISQANERQCSVAILEAKKSRPDPYHLHIAVAPTKMNDRFEWFLEKATEIGVHEITPVICERSERKVVKPDRLQRVVQAAMKQSLRTFMPKLNPAMSFNDFISGHAKGAAYVAHCEPTLRHTFKEKVVANGHLTVLIGPEGDFTTREIDRALKTGYLPVTLGDYRLRTETAAIVACTTVALANQE